MCLSRLYRCVDKTIFQSLSHEAVALCLKNIHQAALIISQRKVNIFLKFVLLVFYYLNYFGAQTLNSLLNYVILNQFKLIFNKYPRTLKILSPPYWRRPLSNIVGQNLLSFLQCFCRLSLLSQVCELRSLNIVFCQYYNIMKNQFSQTSQLQKMFDQ